MTNSEIKHRITPVKIENLEPHQIFVFGSNEAGRHGKGAAKTALRWGAIYGLGEGLHGQTYALPTKNSSLKTLSLEEIGIYVQTFLNFVRCRHDLIFLVTEIGCGLAGLKPSEVAPLFRKGISLNNIWLPNSFWEKLQKLEYVPED